MKKIYSLIAALAFAVASINAQCTIDTSAQTTPGVNPTADQLPCIERGVAFDQVLQVKIQDFKDTTIVVSVHIIVDSVRIDSVQGLPNGIVFTRTPDVLLGGENGCGRIAGTTNDPTGRYDLIAWGTAWLRAQAGGFIDTPYVYNGQLNEFSPFGDYYLDVINTGQACHVTGIKDFNSDLNSALSLYPNPSNGIVNLKLNTGKRVNGEIVIVDITGRRVFAENVDVVGVYEKTVDISALPKGLYTLQLRTSEGFASKSISIE